MTFQQLCQQLTPLYDEGEARAIVRTVLDEAFGLSLTDIVCGKVGEMTEDEQQKLRAMMRRLASAEPVQYVVGHTDFCSRRFAVTPDVLIPRPETAELCEKIISAEKERLLKEGLTKKETQLYKDDKNEKVHPHEDDINGERTPIYIKGVTREETNREEAALFDNENDKGSEDGNATEKNATDGNSAFSILDLCTGSGCIAITLGLELSGSRVTGVDISSGALRVAEQNARSLGADNVSFVQGDVLQAGNAASAASAPAPSPACAATPADLQQPSAPVFPASLMKPASHQLIVSNPPYVTLGERKDMHRNVIDHEPALALFVPDDDPLRFYRPIISLADATLNPGGSLWLEINPLFADALQTLAVDAGFAHVTLHADSRGKARFIEARKAPANGGTDL